MHDHNTLIQVKHYNKNTKPPRNKLDSKPQNPGHILCSENNYAALVSVVFVVLGLTRRTEDRAIDSIA